MKIEDDVPVLVNRYGTHDGDPSHDHDYVYRIDSDLWQCSCFRRIGNEALATSSDMSSTTYPEEAS